MMESMRNLARRWWRQACAGLCVLPLVATTVLAQQTPPDSGMSGFVPANTLPPAQQMPAAPLLIAAYAFIWVALLIYLWSIWRRLGRVENELRQVEGHARK